MSRARSDSDEVSGETFWPRFPPNPISAFGISVAAPVGVALEGDDLRTAFAFDDADMGEVKNHDVARAGHVSVV